MPPWSCRPSSAASSATSRACACGDGGGDGEVGRVVGGAPRGVAGRRAGLGDRHPEVGEPVLEGLVRRQLATELVAGAQVLDGVGEAALGEPELLGGEDRGADRAARGRRRRRLRPRRAIRGRAPRRSARSMRRRVMSSDSTVVRVTPSPSASTACEALRRTGTSRTSAMTASATAVTVPCSAPAPWRSTVDAAPGARRPRWRPTARAAVRSPAARAASSSSSPGAQQQRGRDDRGAEERDGRDGAAELLGDDGGLAPRRARAAALLGHRRGPPRRSRWSAASRGRCRRRRRCRCGRGPRPRAPACRRSARTLARRSSSMSE